MTVRWLVAIALTLTAAATLGARGERQPAPQNTDTTAALLNEVHALRLAIEQSNAVTPRMQVTLARLNIEEQRIGMLAAQLDRARQDLNGQTRGLQDMTDRLASLDKRLPIEVNEQTRRALEAEREEMVRLLKMNGLQQEQARIRENEAAQALSTEQNRWLDLNAKLDELERLLGPIR